jgi:HEAT repeat protein
MRNCKSSIRCFLSLLVFATALFGFGRVSKEEIRHHFLILSSGDMKYCEHLDKSKKRLSKGGRESIEVAIEYIGRQSTRKKMAIEWIAEGVGEDAVEPLTYVLTLPAEDDAAFAAYLLGVIGSPKAAVPLMLSAQSNSHKIRSASISALGNCGDTSAVPLLVAALSDSSPEIRRVAATSLGKIGNESSVKSIAKLLSDRSADVRYAASYAIAGIGGEEAKKLLVDKLKVNSLGELERYHVIETLGQLQSEDALPVLFELLDDPYYLNRGFACQALGYYRGNYNVANALKQSLHDASGFVRMMAEEALQSIRNEQ